MAEELEEVKVTARRINDSRPSRYISFPSNFGIHGAIDPNSESDEKSVPFVRLKVSEIKRDQSGLPAVASGESSSIGSAIGSVADALDTPEAKGIFAAGLASAAGVGEAGTLLTGGLTYLGTQTQLGKDAEQRIDKFLGEVAGLSNGAGLFQTTKNRLKNFSTRRNVEDPRTYLFLPMPENIGISYDHQYLEVGMSSAFGIFGLAGQAKMASNPNSPYATGGTDPYVMELGAAALRQIPGMGPEADRLLFFGTTGLAVNPQLEMIFSSTALRRFILDFRLTPKNAKDAESLFSTDINKGIISALKYYSAPEIPKGTSGRYFIPPAQFEVDFFHNSSSGNKRLFKTKKCVLTSVGVDYTPNGYVTHADGSPAQISLQLSFQETSVLSRADYLGQNDDKVTYI